jgi:hypothetical protein
MNVKKKTFHSIHRNAFFQLLADAANIPYIRPIIKPIQNMATNMHIVITKSLRFHENDELVYKKIYEFDKKEI